MKNALSLKEKQAIQQGRPKVTLNNEQVWPRTKQVPIGRIEPVRRRPDTPPRTLGELKSMRDNLIRKRRSARMTPAGSAELNMRIVSLNKRIALLETPGGQQDPIRSPEERKQARKRKMIEIAKKIPKSDVKKFMNTPYFKKRLKEKGMGKFSGANGEFNPTIFARQLMAELKIQNKPVPGVDAPAERDIVLEGISEEKVQLAADEMDASPEEVAEAIQDVAEEQGVEPSEVSKKDVEDEVELKKQLPEGVSEEKVKQEAIKLNINPKKVAEAIKKVADKTGVLPSEVKKSDVEKEAKKGKQLIKGIPNVYTYVGGVVVVFGLLSLLFRRVLSNGRSI